MKKFTVLLFATAMMWISACDDREEEVFKSATDRIESGTMADNDQNGGDPHGPGPG